MACFSKCLAPKKVSVLQEQAVELLKAMFKNVTINVDIIFSYYSSDDREIIHNEDYPKYISEDNLVDEEVEYEELEDGEEIFDGDIFASVKDRLK